MEQDQLVRHALELLKDEDTLADARRFVHASNTRAGSVMNYTTNTPRQLTEAAVAQALRVLDGSLFDVAGPVGRGRPTEEDDYA